MNHICSVCGDEVDFINDGGAYEEGTDDFWCVQCIRKWEDETGEDWATGKPLK